MKKGSEFLTYLKEKRAIVLVGLIATILASLVLAWYLPDKALWGIVLLVFAFFSTLHQNYVSYKMEHRDD